MSTYLQGFQAYIPQIQPFTPDYNFYQGALEMKQGTYDAAKKQLSSMYGSLLNAPLSREDNIETRDKFFKAVDQDIKKMAGMDLSLAQNSEAAMDVFNQLTDNKNVAHDMVFTKQYQQQQRKGQYLKNCVDPEKCGGAWWEGGDRLMQYGMESYRRANKQDALNMSAPSYVGHQNVMTKAMKIAKDLNLNITQDTIQGGYIVTTKNGALAEPHMQNMLFGTLGNDPKVAEYYKASAKLARQDFMYGNESQYGSLEAAEQAYIQSVLTQSNPAEEQMQLEKTLDEKVSNTQKKSKQLEDKAKNSLPEDRSAIEKMLDDLQASAVGYETSLEKVKEVNHQTKMATTQASMTGAQIDNLIAANSLQTDLTQAAQTLAYKNYEQTLKEDPYSMEAVKHGNRMTEMKAQHLLAKDLALFKNELVEKLEATTLKGGAEHNVPVIIQEGVVGGSAPTDEASQDMLERGFTQYEEIFEKLEGDVSRNEKVILSQVLDRAQAEAEGGNAIAQEDFVTLVANLAMAKFESDGDIGKDPASAIQLSRDIMTNPAMLAEMASKKAIAEKLNSNIPMSEKYALARQYANNNSVNDIEGYQVDLVYDAIMPGLTSLKDGNQYTRDYLAPIWINDTVMSARQDIEAKDAHLKKMKDWYKKSANDAATAVRAEKDKWSIKGIVNPELTWDEIDFFTTGSSEIPGTTLADGIESYYDANGNVNTEEAFIKKMTSKGHSKTLAKNLWGGTHSDPGFGSYMLSWGNAVGTLGVGIFGDILGAIGTGIDYAQGGIPEVIRERAMGNQWGKDMGYDYDTATAMANWWDDAPDAKQRHGGGSIHTIVKQAVSKYVKPDGDMAWTGVTGAGNVAAKGQKYRVIDPSSANSVGAMAMKGIFEDYAKTNSVAQVGGFAIEAPDESQEAAAAIMNAYETDFYSMSVKDKNRPITSMVYSDVAGGDANKMGVNIKFNQNWMKKFKGTAKQQGMLGDSYDDILANGVTLYMDRDGATNIATAASGKTSLEHLMNITGVIPMDQAGGGYTEDFIIKAENGMYKAGGRVQAGVDPTTGEKQWEYFQTLHPGDIDINDLTKKINGILSEVRSMNIENANLYLKQQMSKL